MEMTPQEIAGNCAAGDSCRCLKKPKPWLCKLWGRSSLPIPGIVSAYRNTLSQEQYVIDTIKKGQQIRAEREREKQQKNEKMLEVIRHEDPIKYLRDQSRIARGKVGKVDRKR